MSSSSYLCCPQAEFTCLANGIQVRETLTQAETTTLQFFPYRAIQSIRYTYNRNDKEGQIAFWISASGTPGAGGLAFRWNFPCNSSGQEVYEKLLANIP
jgi:hypothetical protein